MRLISTGEPEDRPREAAGGSPGSVRLDDVAVGEEAVLAARAGQALLLRDLGTAWADLGPPLPFETSVPGVFAVGDVRSGSIKRVAAAVGDGSSAVRSVHRALARRSIQPQPGL